MVNQNPFFFRFACLLSTSLAFFSTSLYANQRVYKDSYQSTYKIAPKKVYKQETKRVRKDACDNCGWQWHPVLSVGGGFLSSSKLGAWQTFPAAVPGVDSFYTYAPNKSTKSVEVFDGFLGLELGIGSTNGALQFGIGYDQIVPFTVKGVLTQGLDIPSQSTYNYQYSLSLSQLLFEAKLLGAIAQSYHPYLFGGYGAAFNRANQYRTSVASPAVTQQFASNTNTAASYALGFGLDVDLDRVFRVGVGYRFKNFGKVKLGQATVSGADVPGTISQSSLYTNELIAQLTVGFV